MRRAEVSHAKRATGQVVIPRKTAILANGKRGYKFWQSPADW